MHINVVNQTLKCIVTNSGFSFKVNKIKKSIIDIKLNYIEIIFQDSYFLCFKCKECSSNSSNNNNTSSNNHYFINRNISSVSYIAKKVTRSKFKGGTHFKDRYQIFESRLFLGRLFGGFCPARGVACSAQASSISCKMPLSVTVCKKKVFFFHP